MPAEALFHAQQCAEKALKAFLTWHQTPFDKTHDLKMLKLLCEPLPASPSAQMEDIGELSQYAWRFRYPGAPYSPDSEEAEQAARMAAALPDAIDSRLEAEFNRN